MGFDPRRWRPSPGSRPLNANVEALLAENEALRREVRSLRLQLEGLLRGERPPREPDPPTHPRQADAPPWSGRSADASGRHSARGPTTRSRVTVGSSHGLSPDLLARWGGAMARHPRWSELRLGPPGGLLGLEEELRRHWWNPALSLEQELDRRCPGLGSELSEALRGPHSRWRRAVRAAFALYGPRAVEWLGEAPLRVVEELLQRLEQLERRGTAASGRRGTRTANTSGAEGETAGAGSRARQAAGGPSRGQTGGTQGSAGASTSAGPSGSRARALALLGLEAGASAAAIKRAYRRLAKAHHPDLGGDAEAFRRLDAAYRSLL